MDQLLEANTSISEVEEDSIACENVKMTELNDEAESMMPKLQSQ
jgi:hypothetical protein